MTPDAGGLEARAFDALEAHSDYLIEKGKFHCHACGWCGPRVNEHRRDLVLAAVREHLASVREQRLQVGARSFLPGDALASEAKSWYAEAAACITAADRVAGLSEAP